LHFTGSSNKNSVNFNLDKAFWFITDISAVDKIASWVGSSMLLLNNIPLFPLAQDYFAENAPDLKIK
jgi:hypothetical protein